MILVLQALVPLQCARAGAAVEQWDIPPPPPALKLDAILGSGMVLPADDAQLWGTATASAKLTATVTAAAGGGARLFHGAADARGSWTMNVSVPAGLALYNISVASSSAPGTAAAAAASAVVLVDVMFGAVIIW